MILMTTWVGLGGEEGWVHFVVSCAWDTCGASTEYTSHKTQTLELENMEIHTT